MYPHRVEIQAKGLTVEKQHRKRVRRYGNRRRKYWFARRRRTYRADS